MRKVTVVWRRTRRKRRYLSSEQREGIERGREKAWRAPLVDEVLVLAEAFELVEADAESALSRGTSELNDETRYA